MWRRRTDTSTGQSGCLPGCSPQTVRFITRRGCEQCLIFRRGEVVADLALLYNLGASHPGGDVRHVSITASSFGSLSPPLPTARSITVAQIISPPGSNNLYGPSLLSGLQKYFRAGLQLVKRGDVLIVPTEIDPLAIHITTALKDISHVSDVDL